MKKILFSVVTKFIVLLLLVACVFQTVSLVTVCLIEYFENDEEIYRFEKSFDDSLYMTFQSDLVLGCVFDGFVLYHKDNPDKEPLETIIERQLNNITFEKVDYKVIINDAVFTNNETVTEQELFDRRFRSYYFRDDNGQVAYLTTSSFANDYYYAQMEQHRDDKIEVYCALKDSFVEECERIWIDQRNLIYDTFRRSAALVLVFLFCFVYLICTCGKRPEGDTKQMWLDKIPVEIHICFIIVFFCLGLSFAFIVFDELFSAGFPEYMVKTLVPSVSAAAVLLVLTSLLSLIRKIKSGTFLKTSMVYFVLKWLCKCISFVTVGLWRVLKKIARSVWSALKYCILSLFCKTTFVLLSLFTAYTAVMAILTIGAIAESEIWFVVVMIVFLCGVFFIAVRAKDFEEISKGASQIRNGNLSYVIAEPKSEDMKRLSASINEIAKGLDESVSAKMKAERLKTDLITNVSHDLKTPLTSIINYTQLLSELENLPDEAKDYIAIISKKSNRLKILTQDLFDISKVQSGNEQIINEKLDVSLLICQSLGEQDAEIALAGITFVTDTEKDLHIYADGRKLSRVMSNLIGNILKYSMKGTRAFVTAKKQDNKAVIEFKNISAYPMDFSSDEITSRFVRGDKSRSKDGSGLGLAIAKSYTEACKGEFDVVIDGDLFKVIIKFDIKE